MSLTRVSPALFQVSNNITSVTVGGSANTVSLTFDSNGVITGASNNALSVANTQITGLIQAAQIGSANATLATSGTLPTARLPTGSVLQVVQGTTSTVVTNSTTTYVDTGLTATITPRSTSSKILVFITMSGLEKSTGAAGNSFGFKLFRDATLVSEYAQYINYTNSATQLYSSHAFNYLDSPSSTSALAYKVQFKNMVASGTVYVQSNSNVSTITLMEIQG